MRSGVKVHAAGGGSPAEFAGNHHVARDHHVAEDYQVNTMGNAGGTWGAKPLLMGRGPPICMPYPPAAGCCGCCCCGCGRTGAPGAMLPAVRISTVLHQSGSLVRHTRAAPRPQLLNVVSFAHPYTTPSRHQLGISSCWRCEHSNPCCAVCTFSTTKAQHVCDDGSSKMWVQLMAQPDVTGQCSSPLADTCSLLAAAGVHRQQKIGASHPINIAITRQRQACFYTAANQSGDSAVTRAVIHRWHMH